MKFRYWVKRSVLLLLTMLGLSCIIFGLTRLVPGGPVEQMLASAQHAEGGGSGGPIILSPDQIQELKVYYGLDKPFVESYIDWLNKVIHGDFGVSFRFQEPVWDLIRQRLPVTLGYGLATILLLYGIAIPLGYLKALHHRTLFDASSSVLLLVLRSIPGFIIGIFLMIVLAVKFELFPMSGYRSDNFADLDAWAQVRDLAWHGFLPIVSYIVGLLAYLTFLTKNALLENIAADYMKLAVAKGLSFPMAVYRHAFRNSLMALAPYVGASISLLVGGSFLIETIFTIDGLGLLGYEALVHRDFPLVLGIFIVTSGTLLLGNLLTDVFMILLNPRIQLDS